MFNDSEIQGNMNGEKGYQTFLKTYLGNVFYLGYSHGYSFEPWRMEMQGTVKKRRDDVRNLLKEMEKQIEREKEKLQDFSFSKMEKEYETILQFIRKNIQLIEDERVIKPKELQFRVTEGSRHQNQEEFDRILTYLDRREAFIREVKKSYDEERLNPGEVQELLEKIGQLAGR